MPRNQRPRHPVHRLLADCAFDGRVPTTSELDDLDLAPTNRKSVITVATEAAALHADGHQARAHEHALQRSYVIVGELPVEQRDPRYLERDPFEDATPLEIANPFRIAVS